MRYLLLYLLIQTSISTVSASPLIIDQSCISSGCFTGDQPGYPVEITRPGSYRMSSNLNVSWRTPFVIQIFASNVSLDFDGFAIMSENRCEFNGEAVNCKFQQNASSAVYSHEGTANVSIFDGHIQGMPGSGILLWSSPARIENMLIDQVGEHGIVVRDAAIVRDCIVQHAQVNAYWTSIGSGGSLFKDSVANRSTNGFVYGKVANVVEMLIQPQPQQVSVLDGSILQGQNVQP